MFKPVWKLFVSFILILNFSSPAMAEGDFQCLEDQQVRDMDVSISGVPLLYWRAKIGRELALFIIEVEGQDKPLFKLLECTKAELREDKPIGEVVDSQFCLDGKIKHLGNLWLPIADYAELENEPGQYVLEDPTQYFRYQVREHLQEYADGYRMDPWVETAWNAADRLVFAGVGMYIGLKAWNSKPKTRWRRSGRWGSILLGLGLVTVNGFAAYSGVEADFINRINRESEVLENIIYKMNEQRALRLDGQDRPGNLEEIDGYSALINSIEKANIKTKEHFCN